uniref:Uncharacterized protein n=1 Tax=Oryza sativa subsp. japonica TaxID=39947 RepID=Q6F2W9_ORYSJ|nr:hypothetical protein [Oryza sativa Japonica Group]
MVKWDRNWMQKWFYINNPYSAEDAQASWLLFERSAVSINVKPNMQIDGTLKSRLILLRKVARRLSTRDLCEEFCLLRISPLARVWDVSVNEGKEVLGLPRLVLPTGAEIKAHAPPPASNAEAATGGSASTPTAGSNVAEDERVDAVPSPILQREGKAPAVEASVSDVTLTALHFVPTDIATRPEITPFMDGVCQVIAPTKGLGLFTELNEFGESCAAVESLFVRGFWEDGGRDCAKIRLRENLEWIARNEEAAAANSEKGPGPSGRSPGHEGEGDGGQDHPEV